MHQSLTIRPFNALRDLTQVENLERDCQVTQGNKLYLIASDLGDPLNRIRNSPPYHMLVAELGNQIVGVIRACIKIVTCGVSNDTPIYAKVAYLLGLRVSPLHRREGVGLRLVLNMEEWFQGKGVQYVYMSTESDNEPSLSLFTQKCGYTKFRSLCMLVNPVHAHHIRIPTRIAIHKLTLSGAEMIYRHRFTATEFLPRDIDVVLRNKLSLGTFIAVPSDYIWSGSVNFLSHPLDSWAVCSVWNHKQVSKFEVRGASRVRKAIVRATRAVDEVFPWLKIPSVPDLFKPFGLLLLYGLDGGGQRAKEMVNALCNYVHNLAVDSGCATVVVEVGDHDPIRLGIPHWKSLSFEEDVWCIKHVGEGFSDWTKSQSNVSIFVDPREF